MKSKFGVFAAAAAAVLGLGMAGGCSSPGQGEKGVSSGSGVSCPYVASPERARQIREGARKVVKGMPLEAVEKMLGKPDEKLQVYKEFSDLENKTGSSGFAYVYLLERKQKEGGIIERGEKMLKIHFNNENRVTNIERSGVN